MHDIVDLRSDTPAMREAMANAEVGDDVWEEDPTVRRLETMAARRLGKDAALFVTSGTQGNRLSVLSHTRPGDEVILDLDSHVFNYEAAGSAVGGASVVNGTVYWGNGYAHLGIPGWTGSNTFYAFSLKGH